MSRFHIVLLILAVIQVVLLVVIGSPDAITDDVALEGHRMMPDLAAADIGELIVESEDGKSVDIKRVGEGWVLANRGDYPARAEQVKSTTKALRKLYAIRKLTSDAKRYHDLEVDADSFHLRVTVKDTAGATIDEFYLGEQGSADKLVYRQVDNDQAWAATGPDSWDFDASTSAWIDTQYTDLSKEDLRKVEIKRKDDSLVLVAKVETKTEAAKPGDDKPAAPQVTETVTWVAMVDGKEATTDEAKVSSLLGSLTSLNLAEPVGKQLKPEFGFDDATATATLTMKDGTVHTLRVGKKREGDANDWYFKSSTSEFVVTLRDYTITDYFNKKVTDVLKVEEKKDDAKTPDKGGGKE
ncbi:MAG: DUF4340 domain-containing protein [Planctomycetota bacterium]|nr:DUF4340 domain-containing protein [Planctomycetota bacterium]